MKSDDLFLGVAIVAVIVSVIGLTMTHDSVKGFENILTGFNVELGFVNVTLTSNVVINISSAAGTSGSDTINWGEGVVESSKSHATLNTVGSGSVVNGSWVAKGGGFIVDNIGNENVTLAIHTDNVSSTFLGGTSPAFQYNFTNSLDDSCDSWVSGYNNTWKDFTDSAVTVCNVFQKTELHDQLRLDIQLIIPNDADWGAKNAVVTLTYSAA